MRYLVVCKSCGNVEKNNIISCSICSKSLEIKYLGDANKNNKVKYSPYREFLPFDGKVFNKFPNSPTPVIQFNEKNIYAKLEYCGFSSSSKDREAFVEIMVAKELGYKGIAAASTVNMGGALASLCAMLKYPCYIFIPNDTSENKVRQIEHLGQVLKKFPVSTTILFP